MTGIRSVQKNGPTDIIVTDEELMASRKPAQKAPAAAAVTAKKTPAKGVGRKPAPKKA